MIQSSVMLNTLQNFLSDHMRIAHERELTFVNFHSEYCIT